MYWHKHDFCSLIFVQHCCDGGDDDDIAAAHGASWVTWHVTAIAACEPAKIITRIATPHSDLYVMDLIFHS